GTTRSTRARARPRSQAPSPRRRPTRPAPGRPRRRPLARRSAGRARSTRHLTHVERARETGPSFVSMASPERVLPAAGGESIRLTMLRKLRTRLVQEESGFTLIELLIVSAIIGILTSIATPSYLGLRDNANKAAASANVYAIVPDIEWYAFDNVAGCNF